MKKRSARDAFASESAAHALEDKGASITSTIYHLPLTIFADYNIDLLDTKKIRVITQQVDSDVQSLRASSVYSSPPPTPPPKDDPIDEDTIFSCCDHECKSVTPTGYAGQFESYEAEHMRRRGKTSYPNALSTPKLTIPNHQPARHSTQSSSPAATNSTQTTNSPTPTSSPIRSTLTKTTPARP